MPVNPATCDALLSPDLARAHARGRRRRERVRRWLVGGGTALVMAGLLAIPLFLLAGLLPWQGLPDAAWQRLGVLAAGSLRAAACAALVALPLGLATALFTAHFCAARLRAWLKPALEMLEALPTVVLGLVATATLAPCLKTHVATLLALIVALPAVLLTLAFAFGARVRRVGWLPLWLLPLLVALVALGLVLGARSGTVAIAPPSPWNALVVGLALGVAALPLVYSVAEDALFLVPREQMQAAFALGATRWQALTTVLLPAAGSGLVAAALLGVSRCLGETMIVLMASGNTPIAGVDPLAGLRAISAELALVLPDTAPTGATYRSLLLAALALLLVTALLNRLAERVRARLRVRLQGLPA